MASLAASLPSSQRNWSNSLLRIAGLKEGWGERVDVVVKNNSYSDRLGGGWNLGPTKLTGSFCLQWSQDSICWSPSAGKGEMELFYRMLPRAKLKKGSRWLKATFWFLEEHCPHCLFESQPIKCWLLYQQFPVLCFWHTNRKIHGAC